MNDLNVWNKWGKLKTVMLGDQYQADFFNPIKNVRVRDALKRIADETQADLEGYERVLKDFGCNVIRPNMDRSQTIEDLTTDQRVQIGPLQVRNGQFVAGNTLYFTMGHKGIFEDLRKRYSNNHVMLNLLTDEEHRLLQYRTWTQDQWAQVNSWHSNELDYGTYKQYKEDPGYFDSLHDHEKQILTSSHAWNGEAVFGPSWTLVGRDLYIDAFDIAIRDSQKQQLQDRIPNIRMNVLHHGGHSDGCFHTIKPGAILSLYDIQHYQETFPGWDVCYLKGESWSKVNGFNGFLKLKQKVNGKWWVPGEEDNDEFTHFVESWLQDWVGFVEESVFDVNVLVLDEHHVCVSQMDNPLVNDFLKKHKMEPVYVPWRHRYFWDGGLHCITLDLEREGKQEDYFPERGNNGIVDTGY